ncbi:MmoB/DmpM family protein [Flexivirga oryzae]|uniref:Phenol hydroxylase P2 protein n=1 Tax=Flexivirga oryzae TaxID=1794944 RepID=A0A839NB54_9MICO|nr:MmoB/DmpM family protein [Flexivirga oryzae]MBB2891951.1 phenol hydroxylase P2 protein [Flexivirga oryzae]
MNAAGTRKVGFDLQEGSDDNRFLVEAISADNPEAVVTSMPGLMRVQAPGRMVINRDSVEQRLGRPWETHEFQLAIVSYFGQIAEWDDDQIVIGWQH